MDKDKVCRHHPAENAVLELSRIVFEDGETLDLTGWAYVSTYEEANPPTEKDLLAFVESRSLPQAERIKELVAEI